MSEHSFQVEVSTHVKAVLRNEELTCSVYATSPYETPDGEREVTVSVDTAQIPEALLDELHKVLSDIEASCGSRVARKAFAASSQASRAAETMD